MTEKERKTPEYYTESGITVTHKADGAGEAWIDTTKKALIHKLVKHGAREVTEQPKGSHYRSFKVPETWIHVYPPPEISEEERALRRERGIRHGVQAALKAKKGHSE